ncbi:MAG TPA: ester cyclase [Acidimicrobiales bacterium]
MEETRAVGIRYYQLVNERRFDELQELAADDYVGHGLGGAGGAEALRRDTEGYVSAFPDLEFSIEDTIVEGDKVVVKTTMRATNKGPFAGVPASGNRVEIGGCDVFRVVNGKIAEGWTLCDSGTLLMQIGAMSLPTAS